MIKGRGGVFEVILDGVLIFSKKSLDRFPEEGEVLGLVREAQATRAPIQSSGRSRVPGAAVAAMLIAAAPAKSSPSGRVRVSRAKTSPRATAKIDGTAIALLNPLG